MAKPIINYDSLNYILQNKNAKGLEEISKKVEMLSTPEWQKFIIPIVSLITAIIGAIGAYMVAMALFKRNRKLELEKIEISNAKQKQIRIEDEQKEIKNRCRILYGELSGLNYELQRTLYALCKTKEEFAYKSFIQILKKTKEGEDKLSEEISASIIKTDKEKIDFDNIYKQYISKLSEYMFLNRETTIQKHLDILQQTEFKPKYSKSYQEAKEIMDLLPIHYLKESELNTFVYQTINEYLHNITSCVYNMN